MTQGGICAPSVMTQNIVSTASQSQSRKPAMHIADGQAAGRNTVPSKSSLLPNTDVQGMVSSSLTPQPNSLSIASAASEEERGQLGQTAALGYDLAHVPLQATTRQGQGNGAATRMLVIPSNSTDQSKRGSVVSAEVDQCAGKSGNESNATDVHQEYSGTSGSDFESQLSDSAVERPSDSGIEGSDNLFIVDDTVVNICPGSGSVKGGIGFYIALDKALPDEVKKGVAVFEGVAAVTVDKTNSLVLSGTVPPSQEVGEVPVTVTTESGKVIGYTIFIYKDDVNEMVKQIVEDRTLQSEFFAKLSQELAKENRAIDVKKTEALVPVHVPYLDSSVETKQKQSVELLQLQDYNAAKRDARWFIETVTSAGQDDFNYYKDRTPWPENVVPAHGNVELAPLQDVHPRLSPNRNAHSTLIDWLELEEAVQRQSLATLESHTRVDQSDDDDDDSSDYFADAETSSCGSFDDEIGWCGISENKEPCVQDEISSEVQNISEYDDLPMPFLSRASFTKDERIIEESTKGESSSEYISLAGEQSSSCFDKEETGEFSELSKFLGMTHIKIIVVKPKAFAIKNERVTEEECTQALTMWDLTPGTVVILDHHILLDASHIINFEPSPTEVLINAISDGKTIKGVWKCFAREFGITLFNLAFNTCSSMYRNLDREKLLCLLKLLMKEQHLLEREQLFAVERLLAQKLSTKTEHSLSVRFMKRERKLQGSYEVSGDPVCKSVNSYEGEPKEVALAILFELFIDPVAAQTSFGNTSGARNSKINQTDKENQQVDENDCEELKLCKAEHGAQATYDAEQTRLRLCSVLHTKSLESNLRKTDKITIETLYDLSCDLRKEWKNLAHALGVRDLTNDLMDERN